MAVESWSDSLEPRTPYEAIDFGFQFVRAYYFRLVALALALVMPLSVALVLVFSDYVLWLSLGAWWTKPIWERPLLYFLSRALFDTAPRVRDVLREMRGYLGRDAFLALTLRRFSPTRSFDLPVTVLEDSKGATRSVRLTVLHRGGFSGAALTTTILLAHVEVLVNLGILTTIGALVPNLFDWNLFAWVFSFEEAPRFASMLFTYFVTVLSFALVAPFYVAAGFSLYLHRRTELEAWDLELIFRRLGERLISRQQAAEAIRQSALVLLTIGAVAASFTAMPTRAADLTPEEARISIDAVLSSDAFHGKDTISIPRFILDWELDEGEETEPWPEWLTDFLDGLEAFLGSSGEIIVIALALALVGWVAYRVLTMTDLATRRPGSKVGRPSVPRVIFGLEISEESLPDDLERDARNHAMEGRPRAALALLYRGALSRLALHYGADLSRGVTERECLAIAEPLLETEATRYFAGLTSAWLRCAYGHVDPGSTQLEGLCVEWTRWFELDGERSDPAGGDA